MDIESDEPITENNSLGPHQIRAKWGGAVSGGGLTGFLALPEVLIRGQHRLGLTATETMVLINVLMHWWKAGRKPFPGNHVIAKRMGISTRTVQRAFMKLEQKKIIIREVHRFHDEKTNKRHSFREIDLDYLVRRLNEIADDLREYNRLNTDGDRTFKRMV